VSRLWDRGEPLDQRVERFTVGRDPELDLQLLPYDALASMAHAMMLARIGVLEADELEPLRRELLSIATEARAGQFTIERAQEDGHTAIENRLTERLGDSGRRIHTGRSRNDQVIGALRLWARERILQQMAELLMVVGGLLDLAERHAEAALPGYSHTRQAMPTTAGHLFAAHAESLLDDLAWLLTAYRHVDRSPLGSASGFGVALPLDRQMVSDLLGFSRLQHNTLAVQNDRGKTEMLVLGAAAAFATDLARLAADLIFYSTDELRCFRLDDAVTTGSSIMPQKRNPDVLELIRAGAVRVRARQSEAGAILGGLTSGYHRDLQAAKEPFLEGMQTASDLLAAMQPVLATLEVDGEACLRALGPTIGATDAVYQRVATGTPFRQAYKEVAANPAAAAVEAPAAEAWRMRTHDGAPGALGLAALRRRHVESGGRLSEIEATLAAVWRLLDESPESRSSR